MADPRQIEILQNGVESWNSWRLASPGVRPDLSDVELPAAQLGRIDLSHAFLRDADLTSAVLTEADLSGTDLSGAYLRSADLRSANLFRADLSGANLAGADLRGANLRGALLDRTHVHHALWSGTRLAFTVLADVDLSQVVGLDAVLHLAPSRIGTDTLFRSAGEIPAPFLEKAGLPRVLIEALPKLLATNGRETYSCFISYSSKDRAFVDLLYSALEERQILHHWIDRENLRLGQDIATMIDDAIRRSDKVVVCCSRSSLTSHWVRFEIDKALAVERRRHLDKGRQVPVVIPLDLDGHLARSRGPHKDELRERLAANFIGWEKDITALDGEFDRLAQVLSEPPRA